MINIFYDDKNKRHFRGKYTKVKNDTIIHPHYILGETKNTYTSIGITHSRKNGKHYNHKLENNPNQNDRRTSYMKKNIETTNKRFYTAYSYKNYQLSKEDEKYVDNRILYYFKKKNKK